MSANGSMPQAIWLTWRRKIKKLNVLDLNPLKFRRKKTEESTFHM
jgi:hypothetical protein